MVICAVVECRAAWMEVYRGFADAESVQKGIVTAVWVSFAGWKGLCVLFRG